MENVVVVIGAGQIGQAVYGRSTLGVALYYLLQISTTAILVLAMTATTFTTQRQLMRKNMPESALTGQYAQQQKLLLYVLPVVFAVGGIAFPIGVRGKKLQ